MRRIALIATTALAAPLFLAACARTAETPVAMTEVPPVAEEPAAPDAPKAQLGSFGFDTTGMDSSVAPGADFYNYANGTWAKNTPIPADKSNYGMFTALDDLSKERVRGIIDELKTDPDNKVGAAYASYLDTASVEAKGLAPVEPWLNEIRAVKTKQDYQALLLKAAKVGVRGPVGAYVGQDDKIPENYIFTMSQGGTGLPDRDMYLVDNEKMKAIRDAYLAHITKMLTIAGEKDAAKRAAAIMDMETKIARVQWTREDSSDSAKNL